MRIADSYLFAAFYALVGLGCEGTGVEGTEGSESADVVTIDGAAACAQPSGPALVRLNEAQNYRFSSQLFMQATPVAPNSNLVFDWSALNTDITQHPVDPALDIQMVELILWNLGEAELLTKLNNDQLSQSDLVALVVVYTDEHPGTSAQLFDFTSFGVELDQELLLSYFDPAAYDPARHSYTVMAASGETAGKGTRMLGMFRLDYATANTQVALHSASTTLEFQADLHSLMPLALPSGRTDIELDWSNMTTNAMGLEFSPTQITRVKVARYQEAVSEIESQFLFLEDIADDLWVADVPAGTSVSLSELRDANQGAFPGFAPGAGAGAGSTWIVALECGRCANPAPWFISVVEPC